MRASLPIRRKMAVLGPGILFAGAAVGNSHLVQATRAGAEFGVAMVVIILFAHLLRYPAFRFGPLYAAATGKSLIEGYRELGLAPLLAVAVSELGVQSIIIAATALTSAAMAKAVFDFTADAKTIAAVLIFMGGAILMLGGYRVLERINNIFVVILTMTTLWATIAVVPTVDWTVDIQRLIIPNPADFAFFVALMGFMPAALDLSIIHSLWVVEKRRVPGSASIRTALLDMNTGYVASIGLAICFLLMGAAVFARQDVAMSSDAAGFAHQILELFSDSVGDWSRFIVGISILSVMFTTLMAVLDGMPRIQAAALQSLRPKNRARVGYEEVERRDYRIMISVLGGGGILALLMFMGSFRSFIDFVTITAFVTAPLIAALNHSVVFGNLMPQSHRPGIGWRVASLTAIAAMAGLGLLYFLVVL